MKSQHPGLRAVLEKLRRQERLTAEDLSRLKRQLADLEARTDWDPDGLGPPELATASVTGSRLAGRATVVGTSRFAARCGEQSVSFYRRAQGLLASTLGIGTYRGRLDSETDAAYTATVSAAFGAGINLVDTSLNYRYQRSERSVSAAVRRFVERDGGSRDEIVVCTKGGFLVPGAIPRELDPADVAGSMHSLAPVFLADQLERSRQNLGLDTIDVYYLHNPETQLQFVDRDEFTVRIRRAFELLEAAAAAGIVQYYGTATWSGYLDGELSLAELIKVAEAIAGDGHRFRFVQLPVHLGLDRATAAAGQRLLESAAELGVTVIASASLMQGSLARDLPLELAQAMGGLNTDAQRAIQFTRSTPGITAALVGMREVAHVAENSAIAATAPLTADRYQQVRQLAGA